MDTAEKDPGEYLARLWDNCASTQPASAIERRHAKAGLILLGRPSAVFGHVKRQIAEKGEVVRGRIGRKKEGSR